MKRLLLKFSLCIYRLIGSLVIIFAILISFLYFVLPIFISTDEIKAQVLKKINLPIKFESIDWGVWGLSPAIVIHDASLYQHKVEKITVELDWVAWLSRDTVKVKRIFLNK